MVVVELIKLLRCTLYSLRDLVLKDLQNSNWDSRSYDEKEKILDEIDSKIDNVLPSLYPQYCGPVIENRRQSRTLIAKRFFRSLGVVLMLQDLEGINEIFNVENIQELVKQTIDILRRDHNLSTLNVSLNLSNDSMVYVRHNLLLEKLVRVFKGENRNDIHIFMEIYLAVENNVCEKFILMTNDNDFKDILKKAKEKINEYIKSSSSKENKDNAIIILNNLERLRIITPREFINGFR